MSLCLARLETTIGVHAIAELGILCEKPLDDLTVDVLGTNELRDAIMSCLLVRPRLSAQEYTTFSFEHRAYIVDDLGAYLLETIWNDVLRDDVGHFSHYGEAFAAYAQVEENLGIKARWIELAARAGVSY